MRMPLTQHRHAATPFQRAMAVLCLLLLAFSVAHTVYGHAGAVGSQGTVGTGLSLTHAVSPLSADTPDTCALCVAMASVVVLAALALTVPRATQPRAPMLLPVDGTVTGWHVSLFSRPPPTA